MEVLSARYGSTLDVTTHLGFFFSFLFFYHVVEVGAGFRHYSSAWSESIKSYVAARLCGGKSSFLLA